MKNYSRLILRVALLLLTALALMWSPLSNGYPFIHSDTGTYLFSSINFGVPLDRPIGYGLFIRAATLAPTLWMVVIAQALGTAYLMLRVAECLLPPSRARIWLAFAIALATILITTVSLFVGFILADIFAAWLWLATILFLLTPYRFERALAALACLVGVWTHNSHVLLAIGLVGALAGVALLARRRAFLARAAWYGAVIVVSILGAMLVNVWLYTTPSPTRGGDTILLSRFHEMGVLNQTLEQNCAQQKWALCELQDLVRVHDREYRWLLHGADSPVRQIGFDKHNDEQRAMVFAALRCCWQTIAVESAAESWRQFWLIQSFDYLIPLPQDKPSVSYDAVREMYPQELATFRASAQQRDAAPLVWLLPVRENGMLVVELIFLLALALAALWQRQRVMLGWLLGTLAFVMWNAVVMATFSGAVTRYQARVVWLIPFAVLIAASALIFRVRNARG